MPLFVVVGTGGYCLNDPSDEAQPRLEFWSTRASIDSEIPSVTAIIETALAVAIYWWAAVRFETYLPLLLSAAVAPLVLLRSDESVKLGARWFKQWEANRWEDDRTYSQLEAPQRRRVLTITAIGTALAALTAFFIADHFNQYFETDNVFWRDISIESLSAAGASAMVIGGALVLMLGGTGAIAAALAVGVEVTIFAVVIVAGIPAASVLTIAIVISEIISGAAVGTRAGAGAGPIGVSRKVALVSKGTPVTGRTLIYDLLFLNSLFYAPFVLGLGLSVFILSLAVRVTATLCHIPAGLRDLPRNFRRLTLCTSPKQTPELIPGLANNETQFSLDYIRQRFRTGRSGDLYDKIFAIILFPPAMLLWFFPGWLYRVTLKSTSWFWWPLAFLSRPPRLSNNPTWLYRKLIRAKLTLYLAYLCIATFVFVSVWRTTEN